MTLKTSSIVWSSQREMLKAAVGAAEQDHQEDHRLPTR